MKKSILLAGIILLLASSVWAQSTAIIEQAVRYRVIQNVETIPGDNPDAKFVQPTGLDKYNVIESKSSAQIEELGSRYGWTISNAQLEQLGSRYGWTISNAQLEQLGSRYGWTISNAQLEQLGSRYGWTISNAQLEQLGSRYGWTISNAQLAAR